MARDWTVPERMRALGREPTPHVSWRIGAAMERWYRAEYGHQPPKALRPKTNGAGSHCFAIYPRSALPMLDRIIATHADEASRQTDMFG